MERQERIKRFENAESIYSIAKAADVSRQSMMRCLKRAGVYTPGDRALKQKLVFSTPSEGDYVKDVKDGFLLDDELATTQARNCPIDSVPEVDLSTVSTKRKIGRNLFVTSKGYIVFDWPGGDKLFGSREEVLSAYRLPK